MKRSFIQGILFALLFILLIPASPVLAQEDTSEKSELTTSAKRVNGLARNESDGKWYYYKDGKVNKSYTGVVKRKEDGCWIYIRKGKWDTSYTGMGKNRDSGYWYRIKKGKVDFTYNGIARRPETGKWYYFYKGKLRRNYTGIARYPKNKKWYHITNGRLDFDYTGGSYRKSNKTWYYVKKGRLKKSYTGFSYEKDNTYYYRKGKRLKGTTTIKGHTFQFTGKYGALKGENGLRITWIGDSYSGWNEDTIRSMYPGVSLHALGGRYFAYSGEGNPSGINILDSLLARKSVRKVLIFVLGTNDEALSVADVEQVVSRAGTRKVIFMTPCNRSAHNYTTTNASIRAVAAKYGNVYLADWESVARGNLGAYFAVDLLHPTTGGGFDVWLKTIRNTYRSILFG